MNQFKKASYLAAIGVFLLGILALVAVSAANYFSFDSTVVMVGELVALLAFVVLLMICVSSKYTYNKVCLRFAEYILTNRKRDAGKSTENADRLKEIQNMKMAAAREKAEAVAAALEQGRSEGAKAALHNAGIYPAAGMPVSAAPVVSAASAAPAASAATAQTVPPQTAPTAPSTSPAVYAQAPNEEMLYNEYGEPVMVRRRVRRTQGTAEGEILYDSMGNPVVRRNQGLWESIEPRQIIVKLETSPNTTAIVTTLDKQGGNMPGSGTQS